MRKSAFNLLKIQRDGYIQHIYLPIETVKRIYRMKRKDMQRARQRRNPRERFPSYSTGFDRASGPTKEETQEAVRIQPLPPGGTLPWRSNLLAMFKNILVTRQTNKPNLP